MMEEKDPNSSAMYYDEVSEALIMALPELTEPYRALLLDWGGEVPGPHIVYGDVLCPYIDQMLVEDDHVALKRIFALVELMAMSDDVRVREVVGATVCEYLGGVPDKLVRSRRYMGPLTRQISDAIEELHSRFGPSAST